MKVNNGCAKIGMVELRYVKPGAPVQFDRVFNEKYPPNELFIVVNLGSYRATYENHIGKIGVISLASGRMSFVQPTRNVVEMNAEVKVNGPTK